MYAVSALAAHMANPSRDHNVALRHSLHYLHGTRDKGITYHRNNIYGISKLYRFVEQVKETWVTTNSNSTCYYN